MEWEQEPNSKKFGESGYLCEVRRHPSLGHLCGYVHLPKGHELFGIGYYDVDVNIHGGLTYAEQEGDDWVFGFDCAHAGDLVPGMHKYHVSIGDVYRNMEYVENETRNLAKQLKEMERKEVE